uniref:Uncharacterized protein n=1 Tax=Chromera velia CCMP2878 TaxID=1169474 RepID=A0A0G4GA86_9ALVE|eukprot:Cvel_20861.t1-p1 / transcript=Cvel_20861.t1 / gene=Cvel_20861 / organism=Chromera_velia_CCMP2878 / gene_product=hypothetical protein / transcript_product=hypothetical protein / location=Cvel_scaffold1911:23135-23596(-) / protein_length=154 / sequence_SO=supercontig / SO=protein_coding / is_pseudo=false
MFEAKASKANLTDAEWLMLVEKHLIKPIIREWLAQESKKRLTFQQLKDAFLLRWTPTETEKNQAVYKLSMLKLAPGDDFKTHKEAFEKLMRISQPGHPHQTRVMPFLGTLYPSLSLDLTREPTVYNDYHQLVTRVCFLHSQQKGKAQVAAADAN